MTSGPKGFHWLHIPTGKIGTSEFSELHAVDAGTILLPNGCMSLLESLTLLNKWNASQPTVWKYWL